MAWTKLAPFIALLGLAFALWRYLDRKFERIDTQSIALNREIGKMEGRLDAVQSQINAPD